MLRAIALTAVLCCSATAAAHPVHPAGPVAHNRNVWNEAREDQRDLALLERLSADYDRAVARRDARAVRNLDGRVIAALRGEVAESRQELRNPRSKRFERRELERTRNILREIERLSGRVDRRAINRKRSLLREAVTLARRELNQGPRQAGNERRRADGYRLPRHG